MGIDSVLTFWIVFIVLNSIYFWPRYILEVGQSTFVPLGGLLRGNLRQRLRWLLKRLNYDIFRVSVDFAILTILYVLLLKSFVSPIIYSGFLFIWFGMSLLYQVYFTVFDKIYHLQPVLFHDWFMLKVALRIFIYEFSLKNLILAIGALVFAGTSFFLIWIMVNAALTIEPNTTLYFIVAIIALLGAISHKIYDAIQFPQIVFQSQLHSFLLNLKASRTAARQVRQLTLKRMKEYNVPEDAVLLRKPNIYFIVVESYGRILADNSEFRPHYQKLLKEVDGNLHEHGWSTSSNFTTSPVMGGASWISYTSMLYGLNVTGQGLFLAMFKNPHIEEFDSMFNWLRRQGYLSYRLSSLGGYKKMDIPYDRYSKLYGVDRWIKHGDLNYVGPEYGFGPSPPDQYALHFGHELMKEETEGPTAMFYITQNSHTPFESPSEVADDWRDLLDTDSISQPKSKIWSRPNFDRYGDAIAYQLRFLSDFIVKKGQPDDIFILVGDHQPASLSIPISRFETPMHVISKDPEFNRLWGQYGFEDGMRPSETEKPLAQEAILWAFIRSMMTRYGARETSIPDFQEHGIPF